MISGYMTKRKNLAHVFVLIDSRHTPQKIDLEFINWLYTCHVPFSLVLTKSDKVSQKELTTHIKLFMDELKNMIEIVPAQYITSAEKK